MHEQLVEPHLAATGRHLEIQTDKAAHKIVPCTMPDCKVDLVVNTFYAPHKGKCEAHSGKKASTIATSHLVHRSSEGAVPNGALANLLCPLCKNTMTIIQIHEDAGFITFGCTDGFTTSAVEANKLADKNIKFCGTSVQIRPNWRAMEFTKIPAQWQGLAEDFNIVARMAYYDKKHDEAPTGA